MRVSCNFVILLLQVAPACSSLHPSLPAAAACLPLRQIGCHLLPPGAAEHHRAKASAGWGARQDSGRLRNGDGRIGRN